MNPKQTTQDSFTRLDLADLRKSMERRGWKHCTYLPDVTYYKRFKTKTRCFANDDKSGMRVLAILAVRDGRLHVTVIINGELSNGTWVGARLHDHRQPRTAAKLEALVPLVLRAWEAMAAPQ